MTTPTVQPLSAASASVSTTQLNSLGSSGTLTAGAELPAFDNSTTKYTDVRCAGNIKLGTSPSGNTYVFIYLFEAQEDGGPTWPDVFDGTASAETITSQAIVQGLFQRGPAAVLQCDGTSAAVLPFDFWVGDYFGGHVPKNWGRFVTHNTGVALAASGHSWWDTGYNDQIPSI